MILKTLKDNLPNDLFEKTNNIIFKTESQINLIDEFDPKKEIEFCFNQLQKRNMQKELNRLNLEIKQAEIKKDGALIKKLTEDFNKLIKINNRVGFLDKKKADRFKFPEEIPLRVNFKQFTTKEAE